MLRWWLRVFDSPNFTWAAEDKLDVEGWMSLSWCTN